MGGGGCTVGEVGTVNLINPLVVAIDALGE